MTIRSISSGFKLTAKRPGLALLVYLVNLFVALVISIPIFGALSMATANSGFGPDLVERFDIVLLIDIIEKAGDALLGSWVQLIWTIPLILLWKVAASVGIIHALRDGGIRPFWEGVGRYTGRALLMALLFVVLVLAWLLIVTILVFVGGLIFSTTPSAFVIYWIVMPIAIVVGLAVIDVMHDYGRIFLVSKEGGVASAWVHGMKYPFRHPSAVLPYAFWAVVAIGLSAAAVRLHASWAPTMAGVWLLFLGQQVIFFLRSATTVAWFGSEVSFAERQDLRDAPLIADAPAPGQDLNFQTA